ncbi:response regulator [Alkalimonas collagenimarina]|uniref:Response regulator n=1 Tax=Alkalimonas collagenimarina TaxID=400390 RepID=A0ABT9H0N4_9GAMM|nr:response regulator [Alkalimonas collagenimarina]MDP4536868.1 response regulator [Alkalimonas collagenimarina]
MTKTKLCVLIVDDVAAVRSYLKQILLGLGVPDIVEAADGAEARALYTRLQPQLVFLDIQLPDMNGKELLRQFKSQNQHSQIVMVSAFSSVSNLKDSIAAGANAFVVKPFSVKRISHLMQPYLN